MRKLGARWLLLAAILAILGGVGLTYRNQQQVLKDQAPAKPDSLPHNLNASAQDWQWSQASPVDGHAIVQVRAKTLKQEKDSSRLELENVELRIFSKKGDKFDLVKSLKAEFRVAENLLYSDGDVQITLGVPSEGTSKHRLVSIQSSAVTFDSKTGKANTDRPCRFTFENGDGKSLGATYDPGTKELHMRGGVEVNWQSSTDGAKPMKIESGELIYQESSSAIILFPWAKLYRENAKMEGADTVVTLKDGKIRLVEAQQAKGSNSYPKRTLDYSADRLTVDFSDIGEVEKVAAASNARVVSTSEGSQTTTLADRIDMLFENTTGDNALKMAVAHGHGVVESKPLPGVAPERGAQPLPETRILRSELIELKMRPGGQDIETVETHAPGRMEFLPNSKEQRRRQLDGERISIVYRPGNVIQSFRSTNVESRTDALVSGPPLQTWSKNLLADFDPKTGQMTRMQQWDDFRYVEGNRKATAQRAVLDKDANRITLETAARMWDPSGSTSADIIRIDQNNGSFTAEGRVRSSRLPDKQKSASEMLSGDEPVQAMANKMTSADHNNFVTYTGSAVLWQGANRIRAEKIEIDREARKLIATSGVETRLAEKEKEQGTATAAVSSFTIVKAANLLYTDTDRQAYYTGSVFLTRPGTEVKALELRAYLTEPGSDSRLEKAFADGSVDILQVQPDRTRRGTAQHAEHYVAEQKVILRGGDPFLVDSKRGNTRGTELTYFANDDRLLVNGAPERLSTSRLRRRSASAKENK